MVNKYIPLWFLLSAALGFLFLAGCRSSRETHIEKIKVVATIPPLADFVRQIGGERVSVTTLLTPGTSPHTFEPAPSQARAAEEADLIVRVGLDVDHWVDDLLPEGKRTVTAGRLEGIELINEHLHEHHEEGHEHVGANPHIWLDPLYVKLIVTGIAEELSSIDTQGSSLYEKNRDRYHVRLDSLHIKIKVSLSDLPSRKYVSYHPAWVYFAARYGLERIGVIVESAGKEPSPRSLEQIIEDIKREGARMVFAEPQFSPQAAEVIADEAGVRVLFLDPLGTENETYLELMERNLETFVEALGNGG